MNLNHNSSIILIGVAGSGMNALAHLLLDQGKRVKGVDLQENDYIIQLKKKGLLFSLQKNKEELFPEGFSFDKNDCIVYSESVSIYHPDLKKIIHKGHSVYKRREVLNQLSSSFVRSIAISGSHGKTTTTALVTQTLSALVSPENVSFYLGGSFQKIGLTASFKKGSPYFVFEADEFDKTITRISPSLLIITNLDKEHLESYAHCYNKLKSSFLSLMKKSRFLFICADEPHLLQLAKQSGTPFLSYGTQPHSDYWINNIKSNHNIDHPLSSFQVTRKRDHKVFQFKLPLWGNHNILNAVVAFVVSDFCLPLSLIPSNLFAQFRGVKRRFEVIKLRSLNLRLVSDYAHHPQELIALFQMMILHKPLKEWVVLFEPHTISRVKNYLNIYAKLLSLIDRCYLMNVYKAREEGDAVELSNQLAQKIRKNGGIVSRVLDLQLMADKLNSRQPKDSWMDLLIIGAGSVDSIRYMLNN